MDLTVFPLYADGSTGDALVEHTFHPRDMEAYKGVGILIADAGRRALANAKHEQTEKPVALDITVTLDQEA